MSGASGQGVMVAIWVLLGMATLLVISLLLRSQSARAAVDSERARLTEEWTDRARAAEARRAELVRELETRTAQLDWREERLLERDKAFKRGFVAGRTWLAEFIADADAAIDLFRIRDLEMKKRPAPAAAATVADVSSEKRALTVKLKLLEYQLKSYEEWFPSLVDYREALLEELIPVGAGSDAASELEKADPALPFLFKDEYEKLEPMQRNQLALDRYRDRQKSNWEIGRHYERFLGHLYEKDGWLVTYHGAVKGFEDFGRDLICERFGEVDIVQAKCWSKSKVLHEKHVFQLFGTTMHYRKERPEKIVTPVLIATTELSDFAREAAEILDVRVETRPLVDFPLVKCNVNPSTGERIYHLPFDQQYDRVQIKARGESFEWTVEAAEDLGFRRAHRHRFG